MSHIDDAFAAYRFLRANLKLQLEDLESGAIRLTRATVQRRKTAYLRWRVKCYDQLAEIYARFRGG